MIRDKELKFSDGQDVKADANSDNYVDLGAHFKYDGTPDFGAETPDIGESEELEFNCIATTAITGTATALQIDLYHHTAATSGASTIISSGAVLMTKTISGAKVIGTTLIRALLPAGTINRYLAVKYTDVSTDVTTAGVDTWIANRSETPKQ